MPELLTDGTVSWIGGMDTSRSASDIAEIQYSKAANVIIAESLGGIKSRFGIHHCAIKFEDKQTEEIYRNGSVQGGGWFSNSGIPYLVVVVDGYVLRMRKIASKYFFAEANVSKN